MEHTDGQFKGPRDLNIYYQAWLPDQDVKAVLLILHGMSEHSGRYLNVVNHFVPMGYAVYAYDNIGHGKSDGLRRYIERFDEFSITLKTFYTMVSEWQTDKPIFLIGHSMGSFIAIHYLLDHQTDFSGAILCAPPIKVGDDVSQMSLSISKVLSAVLPKLGMMLTSDNSSVSRDPDVVRNFENDPLVHHGKTPVRLIAELVKAGGRIGEGMNSITLPFFVLQGGEDKLTEPGSAQLLYDNTSSVDKTIKVYEGLYHEVFNEPEREIVLKDVENWLAAHI